MNKAVLQMEKAFSGRPDVQILHSTGKGNFDAYMEQVKELGRIQR
jgi:UDP-N-acetylglucosamine--N-acetylmuramyl-(pentapeptide) pyrophosphoryl-undecaprenol N-acetylglucosamine transferase